MKAISEKTIEKQILIWLRAQGYKCSTKIDSTGIYDERKGLFRMASGTFKRKGVSDIYVLHKGKSIWIEVKSHKGRLSDNQKEWLNDVNAAGGIGIVARSIDDVAIVFKTLFRA